jgi:eukaryotic-like serine/threonine-protein kinase
MPTREPVQPQAKPAVVTGTMFGRYKLLGRIGEGGMAEVYRALMTGPEGFERELVLKRILPRLSDTGDFKTMFIREAKISALLLHPNIVQIYEFGEADGAYFIAMENVQGVTLREALTTLRREQRAMPYLVAADIARQICIGLDYAHTLHGPDGRPLEIVHQDISPTNIMLAYTGTVKILDFGIARAASFAEEETKKGLIKGKVSYLSPEQIHVRPFDARADVFALGVVFHEMLTGRRLFQAKNDIGKMRQLLAQPVAPPSSLNATIPRELDRIVMRALSIDVTQRFQSVADMASDLERTLIAARYSSRELSKLLHGLFLPDEDPVVVVDTDDHRTVAMTGTTPGSSSGTSGGGSNPTGTGTATGVRTPSLRSTSPSISTSSTSMSNSASHSTPGSPGTRPSPAGKRPTSPSDAVTDPLPPIPDASELRPSDSGAQRLERVVQAERGRLARKRMRGKLRIVGVIAGLAIIVGAGVWAGHRYLPALLAPPPPPPKPVLPVALPNQTAPEPAAKPKRQPRPPRHKGAHATSPAADTPSESPAPGDEQPAASAGQQKP